MPIPIIRPISRRWWTCVTRRWPGLPTITWKLHNLTLILGARIEHLGPWMDKHNNGMAEFSDALYTQHCSGYTRNCASLNMPGITWSWAENGSQSTR